jgi:hypothetical protein
MLIISNMHGIIIEKSNTVKAFLDIILRINWIIDVLLDISERKGDIAIAKCPDTPLSQ